MIRRRAALVLFRLVVGGVFLYAGVIKIMDPLAFAGDVENYRVVGRTLAFLTAVYLPWIEVFAGAFLISGVMMRGSALLVSTLLAGFIGLVVSAMIRGLDVDCGCFGTFSRSAGWELLLEDGALMLMSLAVLLAPKRKA